MFILQLSLVKKNTNEMFWKESITLSKQVKL